MNSATLLTRQYPIYNIVTKRMSSSRTICPRIFAPLDPGKGAGHKDIPRLKGIVFDVDGTLCLPQNWMFKEMRAALDIPKGVDIIDHIRSLSNEPDEQTAAANPTATTNSSKPPSEDLLSSSIPKQDLTSPQSRAVEAIRTIERNAMTKQIPQPGLQELMTYLSNRGIPKAICTRNFPAPVHHLLGNHLPDEKFHPMITRDTEGVQPKPSPEGIWKIAQTWGFDQDAVEEIKGSNLSNMEDVNVLDLAKKYLGSGLIMVGDSIDDMTSGHRAGAATVLLVNEDNSHLAEHAYTDLVIRTLDELIDVLDNGFVGRS